MRHTLLEQEPGGLRRRQPGTPRRRKLVYRLESTEVLTRSYSQPWGPARTLDEGYHDTSDAPLGRRLVEELAHRLHEEPWYILLLAPDCTLALLRYEEH